MNLEVGKINKFVGCAAAVAVAGATDGGVVVLLLLLFGQPVIVYVCVCREHARYAHQNPCKKLIRKNSWKPLEKWHGCDMALAFLPCYNNVCSPHVLLFNLVDSRSGRARSERFE